MQTANRRNSKTVKSIYYANDLSFKLCARFKQGYSGSHQSNFQIKANHHHCERGDNDYDLAPEMKNVLEERLQEDETTYLTAKESINQLDKKYGL